MPAATLTAEQFAEQLLDLPDGGRWVELHAGEIVTLEPPDEAHGNIVLNLSKALGAYLGERRDEPAGYVCFDLGIVVARAPDTVHRPAVSFFARRELFAESEKLVTGSVPQLVIEAATTGARRRALTERIGRYHSRGVECVWVADPVETAVHVCHRGSTPRQLSGKRTLEGAPLLPGFSLSVADVFAEPSWWR